RCAKAVLRINRLSLMCTQRQNRFNALAAQMALAANAAKDLSAGSEEIKKARRLSQKMSQYRSHYLNASRKRISDAYKPLVDTSADVRKFVVAVRNALHYTPSNSPHLQNIRNEIERLQLFTLVARPGVLPMTFVHDQLLMLRHRLAEFEGLSVGTILDCRRKIVDNLQTVLGCRREEMARILHVTDSAIRAAIRGDQGHSGPTAEEKILDACREHKVDARLWR